MMATQIKQNDSYSMAVRWDDGHQSTISLKTLRDSCPCAGCQGETVLLRTFQPLTQADLPGRYDLKGAQQVGSYALQIYWGDGHSTGIYTWQTLRNLCECDVCLANRSPSSDPSHVV